jgi:hypothetical protein
MNTPKRTARIAGALYLALVLSGLFSLMYVPKKLSDWNNTEAMINNIIANETLFRLGIFVGIFGYIIFALLPLALFKLLSPVNKIHAVLMVTFAVVSVPISLVNMLHKFDVLTLLGKANYLNTIDVTQLHTQIIMHLDYYRNGNQLASIFWGLWLFPFGYLVYKSGFLPKIIGVLLMFGCFGYVINFTGDFLFTSYDGSLISRVITIPGSLGEIGICLWMLIVGTKGQPSKGSEN